VNGPLATELAINAGANCLGPGARANAALGRSLRLVLQNVGAALPGVTDMATLGQPGKAGWCFAENEAASPWEPLHVTRGHSAAESAVTVFGAAGSVEVVLTDDRPEGVLARLGAVLQAVSGGTRQSLLVLPPESAMFLNAHRWDRARLAAELARYAAGQLDLPRPGENGSAPSGLPPAAGDAEVLIVVAGGIGVKAAVIPSWSGATRAVTRAIEPL
jgi:hypothetical protein